jgi:hypothetical protein
MGHVSPQIKAPVHNKGTGLRIKERRQARSDCGVLADIASKRRIVLERPGVHTGTHDSNSNLEDSRDAGREVAGSGAHGARALD